MPVTLEHAGSDFGVGTDGDAYRKSMRPLDTSGRSLRQSIGKEMEDHYIGLNVLSTRSMIGAQLGKDAGNESQLFEGGSLLRSSLLNRKRSIAGSKDQALFMNETDKLFEYDE